MLALNLEFKLKDPASNRKFDCFIERQPRMVTYSRIVSS